MMNPQSQEKTSISYFLSWTSSLATEFSLKVFIVLYNEVNTYLIVLELHFLVII